MGKKAVLQDKLRPNVLVHGPYLRKDGRKHVVLYWRENDARRRQTISYPKWLMEQHVGRTLTAASQKCWRCVTHCIRPSVHIDLFIDGAMVGGQAYAVWTRLFLRWYQRYHGHCIPKSQ